MAESKTASLVKAPVLADALGIPVWAVYRLVDQGRLPFKEVGSTWSTRKRYVFDLEAAKAAYAQIEAAKQQAS